MGKLISGATEVDFDDRALVHLQSVIGSKLRRGESFALFWSDPAAPDDARPSLWLHPGIPLYFKFTGTATPRLNRAWIEVLATSADSADGLLLSSEPRGRDADQNHTD
ncbi:hypothetical protein RCH12_000401 [Cryobacterium sp. MP_3.1]|uniref:DUF7882 family protein n=1 Tax=Cryobacterium sp. MP_3.1 TaxID=3071711 RepID=UPI002DFDE6B9|nr:hypothetical protein [Cryobacterium sp. MP_3.1]